ncbi:MAG: DUF6807 family protein [Rhodothermales bacterium]
MTQLLIRLPLVFLAALLMLAGCTSESPRDPQDGASEEPARPSVTVSETAEGYVFTEGDDSIMVYHATAPDPDRPHARAHYVHPLYGLEGTVLTEDFPEDHLHQHGLFWAWHQIYVGDERVGDGWMQENVEWVVRNVETHDEGPSAAILATVDWFSPLHEGGDEPFIEERATLIAHPVRDGYRTIDVTIELRGLVEGVRLGGSEDEKGYGGLSLRIQLPDDVTFAGPDGRVEPRETAVAAGPWVNITATFDPTGDDSSGVAILQHPTLPTYPQPWILRAADSMQNPKWPGEDPVLLSTEEPVTLRYRLVVHDGSANAVTLNNWHDVFG